MIYIHFMKLVYIPNELIFFSKRFQSLYFQSVNEAEYIYYSTMLINDTHQVTDLS